MTTYRFLNADHTLVLRDENTVIQWDPRTNQPTERLIGSGPANSQAPPLQPVRTPPNEIAEPFDNREDQARASMLGQGKQLPPPDEMKLWHDAGSPEPQDMVAARIAAATARAMPDKFIDPRLGVARDDERGAGVTMTMLPWEPAPDPARASADLRGDIEKIEAAIGSANDIGALRMQLSALATIVHETMIGRAIVEPTTVEPAQPRRRQKT